MKKAGADIGYGHTKGMDENKTIKFSSSVSIVKTKLIDSMESINFEGKEYYVGEDALSDAIKTRDYSFIYTYSPIFIYNLFKELDKLNELNEYEIHTGLSLYDIEKGIEVVLDIGYRTNDIIIFKDGSPSKSESNADDKGVNIVINELKTYLNREFDITFTEQEVMDIFYKKEILIYGKPKDLSFKIDEMVENYFEIIYSSLRSDYGKILKSAVRVIISGGGAYILENFKHKLPGNVVFDTNRNFEFANVRGYYFG